MRATAIALILLGKCINKYNKSLTNKKRVRVKNTNPPWRTGHERCRVVDGVENWSCSSHYAETQDKKSHCCQEQYDLANQESRRPSFTC